MKYVLDASVAWSWVMHRPMTSKALALRNDFSQQIHELIAPSTFGAEVASGLTKVERQKRRARRGSPDPVVLRTAGLQCTVGYASKQSHGERD
jgi:hypothetical protein